MELIHAVDPNFRDQNVRNMGTKENVELLGKDVCSLLGHNNITNTLKFLPKSMKGYQEMITVSEAGMYKLFMRSKKPVAQKFQDWVCEELLPTLRKSGQFIIESLTNGEISVRKVEEVQNLVFLEEENKGYEPDNNQTLTLNNDNSLSFMSELTEGQQLRVFGTHDTPYFVAKDIAKMLGYTNTREAINDHIDLEDKITCIEFKKKYPNNVKMQSGIIHPHTILINQRGLQCLIQYGRKHSKELLEWYETNFQVKCNVIKRLSKEEEYIKYILESFDGEYMIRQFPVNNYRVDLYFPEYRLAIECDENGHSDRDQTSEETREMCIEDELKCSFIRFNPDDNQFNIFQIINKIYNYINTYTITHSHELKPCVYILENPDYGCSKYKIGKSININDRLKSERITFPNIKVRLIIYIEHYNLFENTLKIRLRNHLEPQSNEWVLISLEPLITIYRDINRTCGYNGLEEDLIWKYNMESPDPEDPNKDAKNMPKYQKEDTDRYKDILRERLIRYDYNIKNNNAPDGQRFCNGFCQQYRLITEFMKISMSYSTTCIHCDNMADIAAIRIKSGALTPADVRRNPSVLKVKEDERICRKCMRILHLNEFPPKRRQCSSCRNKVRSKFGDTFDDRLESEVNLLRTLPPDERHTKIETYVKDELRKIIQYLKLGRKYNDNKQDLVEKVQRYFIEVS